ncbi:endonuclease V [Falsiroseomonas tokyonensis]|uniref:Endonuclease V n=1 Tax=Falsiroseomonas tokyonensis TaxID=430521 RepID=A0ABV7BLM4_9PROT|nr:endonuclease V [Falsiroseomonas tokyonensis]MBU8536483.1 endonuclease V [Falsiroseomonas tokyonensis]
MDFPTTAAAARLLQPELAARVITQDALPPIRVVAGADASTLRFDPTRTVHAAMVALDAETLTPLGEAGATRAGGLPYIPGLLGFREVPPLAEAFARLPARPDLILVDGHGLAHPRGLGVACLLGVTLDVPTIGVAKSLLVGSVEGALADTAGAEAPLVWKDQVIGAAMRTRRGANPIYVSIGHRISLRTALAWVRALGRGRRLPEPTRLAHEAATRVRLAARPAAG